MRSDRSGLQGDDASGRQAGGNQVVELTGIEAVARTFFNGVRQVDDNRVEDILVSLQPAPGILDNNFGPRILECAGVKLRQELARDFDDFLIHIHHDCPPDRSMPERFTQGRALPAPDDQDALRIRMGQ